MLGPLLRAHRRGFLASTLLGVVSLLVQAAGFAQIAGRSEAERQAFAHQIQPLALQLTFLLPLPHRLDTIGGYLAWRAIPLVAVAFAVWGVLSAAGATRGEEDRGLIDTWLAAPVGRTRWVAARVAAFAGALALSATICLLAAFIGARAGGFQLALGGLAAEGFALWALGLAWFGIALLLAQQVPTGRRAAGVGASVLVVLFFADSLARNNSALEWAARLSPFHLLGQTTAMIPGGRLDVAATLVLIAVGLGTSTLAAFAFAWRDLGAPLIRLPARARTAVRQPARNPLLRVAVANRLWQWRWPLIAWTVGAAALAALMVSVAQTTGDLIRQNAALHAYLNAASTDPALSMLALGWFGVASLGLALLAVIRTATWSEEDSSGRLELALAQPVPRWRVIVERAVELGCSAALVAGVGTAVVVVAAGPRGIHLDTGRVIGATALLLPLALSFGALGAALSAWRPRVAVAFLTAFAVVEWFLQQIGPLFRWPDWVRNLSLFQLYGNPLVDPIFWNGLWAMLAITLAGFLVAAIAMQRRDVGR
jgi:ABC-2 type transport system permease protein